MYDHATRKTYALMMKAAALANASPRMREEIVRLAQQTSRETSGLVRGASPKKEST